MENINFYQELSLCLYVALSGGMIEISELLLARYPDILCTAMHNDLSSKTVLHAIVRACCPAGTTHATNCADIQKNLKYLQLILSKVPTETAIRAIKTKDSYMKTPLHIAVNKCGVAAAKLMIEKLPEGCIDSSEWEDGNKHPPTFYAVVHNQYEIVEALIKSKTWKCLDKFVSYPSDSVVYDTKEGMNLQSDGYRYMALSPLSLSSYMGYVDIVLILLKHKADPNIKNKFSEVPNLRDVSLRPG